MDITPRPPIRTGCTYLLKRSADVEVLSSITVLEESNNAFLIKGDSEFHRNHWIDKNTKTFHNNIVIDVLDSIDNETNCDALIEMKNWQAENNIKYQPQVPSNGRGIMPTIIKVR